MDLRKQFFNEMEKIAEQDENVILLVGDLGYSFMENYAKRFPYQFINCGVAEQNMIGVAAGLALGGMKPYVYTGAIFAVFRPYEFVRDDIAYANLDVKIIGTGHSGFLGHTHNLGESEDEVALINTLPNIRGVKATEETLPNLLRDNGSLYIRL